MNLGSAVVGALAVFTPLAICGQQPHTPFTKASYIDSLKQVGYFTNDETMQNCPDSIRYPNRLIITAGPEGIQMPANVSRIERIVQAQKYCAPSQNT